MSPPSPETTRRARLGISAENRRIGRRHLGVAILYGAVAIAALAVNSAQKGTFQGKAVEPKVVASACLVAFLVFGIVATRRIAKALYVLTTARAARAASAGVRLVVTAVGYVVVLFGALGLAGVNAEHLLVGGTVAGIVLGIAAQQSLSNVFAGFVLSVTHPFTVGDNIRVRSGSLNGPFDGVVLGMSLTYVTLFVDGGIVKVPNSAMLASGIGQYPAKDRSTVEAAQAAGAPFTPPQGIAAVPGPVIGANPTPGPPAGASPEPPTRPYAPEVTPAPGATPAGGAGVGPPPAAGAARRAADDAAREVADEGDGERRPGPRSSAGRPRR